MAQTGQSEAIHSPRRVRQNGGQVDQARGLVDGGRLHGCDLVLA
jgi:hypothetical protein